MRLNVNAHTRWMGAGLVLSLLLPASSVLAANGETQRKADEKPDIVLHGEATSAWSLATSGSVLVDGRLVGTQDRLENGSRIVVDARSTARAEIKDVGRIQLSPRTEVVLDMIDDTIVAKMIQGSMRVEVAARYGTYVETPDSRIVSHPGMYAAYRVKADPLAGTTVEKGLGDVSVMAVADDDNHGSWDIDVPDGDNDFHMKARHTETLKIKVKNGGDHVANQPVVFAITTALEGATGQFTEGVQRITTTTDNDGEASVEFESGAAEGQVYVEAFIPGTEAHETLHVYIEAKEKTFWNPATTTLYAAIGAGVIAGTVLAINNRGRDHQPGVIVNPPVVSGKR